MSQTSGLLCAILFVAGEPVETADLCAWMGVEEAELASAISELEALEGQGAGLTVIHIGTKVQLVTSPRYARRLQDIFHPSSGATLSSALLETLTIIAYQQPVTRAEVEQIRGVRSVYPIATLVERGLVRKVGSKPVLGTPVLYGTTDDFLRQFGLSSLADLPALQPEDVARIPAAPEGAQQTGGVDNPGGQSPAGATTPKLVLGTDVDTSAPAGKILEKDGSLRRPIVPAPPIPNGRDEGAGRDVDNPHVDNLAGGADDGAACSAEGDMWACGASRTEGGRPERAKGARTNVDNSATDETGPFLDAREQETGNRSMAGAVDTAVADFSASHAEEATEKKYPQEDGQ